MIYVQNDFSSINFLFLCVCDKENQRKMQNHSCHGLPLDIAGKLALTCRAAEQRSTTEYKTAILMNK